MQRSSLRMLPLLALAAILVLPVGMSAISPSPANDPRSSVWFQPPPAASGALPSPDGPAPANFPGEYQVTHSPAWQNEPNIAVNPTDGKNLIAGGNDWRWHGPTGGSVWAGVYTSHDGGATWKEQPLPGAAGGPTGFLPFGNAGDPIEAFTSLGTPLSGGIDFGALGYVFVSASADGGDSWLQPVLPGANLPIGFQDKPDMAADPNLPLAYVCWTNFLPGFFTEFVAVSSSAGGAAWVPAIPVSEIGSVQGCSLAVGADGTVYLAYQKFNGCLNCGGKLEFVSSPAGGAAWSLPVTISSEQPVSCSYFRCQGFPLLAVDNSGGLLSKGNLYVVWAENRAGVPSISLSRSTDHGATWSTPIRVDSDGGSGHFMPNVAVGKDGAVYVSFYAQQGSTFQYMAAKSTNGGQTFTEFPLASAPTPGGATGFFGDYTDLQVGPDGVMHAVWTDARTGDQDIWTRAFN